MGVFKKCKSYLNLMSESQWKKIERLLHWPNFEPKRQVGEKSAGGKKIVADASRIMSQQIHDIKKEK